MPVAGFRDAVEPTLRDLRPHEVRVRVEASRTWTSGRGRQRDEPCDDDLCAVKRLAVGTIESTGTMGTRWSVGQRVAIGLLNATIARQEDDGGLARTAEVKVAAQDHGDDAEPDRRHAVVSMDELILVPPELDALTSAGALAIGIEARGALDNSFARAGEWFAVLGLCAVACMGIQIARALGCRIVVISSDGSKQSLAERLGASLFLDASYQAAAPVLAALGGVTVILTTEANRAALPTVARALRERGRVLVLRGAGSTLVISAFALSSFPGRFDRSFPGGTPEGNAALPLSLTEDMPTGGGDGTVKRDDGSRSP